MKMYTMAPLVQVVKAPPSVVDEIVGGGFDSHHPIRKSSVLPTGRRGSAIKARNGWVKCGEGAAVFTNSYVTHVYSFES
jgi:hypothetical protein